MNDRAKLIGWSAIAVAIVGILTGLRDMGAMLFVGTGDSAPTIGVQSRENESNKRVQSAFYEASDFS